MKKEKNFLGLISAGIATGLFIMGCMSGPADIKPYTFDSMAHSIPKGNCVYIFNNKPRDGINIDSQDMPFQMRDGKIQTGWIKYRGKTMYVDENGQHLKGLQKIDDAYYYFSSDGFMQSGIVDVDGKKYIFDSESGKQITEKGYKGYYLKEDGTVITSQQYESPEGLIYLDSDGKKVVDEWIDGYYYQSDGIGVSKTEIVKNDIEVPGFGEKERLYALMDVNGLGTNEGGVGRLVIPDVGIGVAVYVSTEQWTVDAADSAAYLDANQYGGDGLGYFTNIIVDHAHQGFDGIKRCVPQQTVAYIVKNGTVQKYLCIGIDYNSTNTGFDIVMSNGNTLFRTSSLGMYTCNDTGGVSVTTVVWQYLGTI